ncbi:hypothetical protein SAMN05444266_110194 [Chitinophaga jiangningensis]|uniref:Uncharacterized protein n=1 Tax=Chitinophaga jiangningensis TaxID=1419482 RepID=A0A1M7L8G8_9BACT|nr:hypothetical protein [Chitinophaga jiangningensis]SHM74304.1 hypothetical protein SAMN05444266_110194 [Chitinophaga jiangningensis]
MDKNIELITTNDEWVLKKKLQIFQFVIMVLFLFTGCLFCLTSGFTEFHQSAIIIFTVGLLIFLSFKVVNLKKYRNKHLRKTEPGKFIIENREYVLDYTKDYICISEIRRRYSTHYDLDLVIKKERFSIASGASRKTSQALAASLNEFCELRVRMLNDTIIPYLKNEI